MNSDHLRTSEGMPSGRGSFSLMHWAKSMAVCRIETSVFVFKKEGLKGGGEN